MLGTYSALMFLTLIFYVDRWVASASLDATLVDPYQELTSIAATLTTGAIEVDVPDRMTQGDEAYVHVTITRPLEKDIKTVIDGLAQSDSAIAADVKVTSDMYVDVRSDNGAFTIFRVMPDTREQFVPEGGDAARWMFSINADQPGEQQLRIIAGVSAVVKGKETSIAYSPYTKTIVVAADTWARAAQIFTRYQDKFLDGFVAVVFGSTGATLSILAQQWWTTRKLGPAERKARRRSRSRKGSRKARTSPHTARGKL